jgi:hypothetical protein
LTFDGLVVGVEIGLFGVEDGVGVDEVEEVEEDEVELVELVELVLEVDELDEVEELETEEGGILETGEVELDETETGEGVGVWEVLGDGVVEVVVTRGSLTTAAPPCSSVF